MKQSVLALTLALASLASACVDDDAVGPSTPAAPNAVVQPVAWPAWSLLASSLAPDGGVAPFFPGATIPGFLIDGDDDIVVGSGGSPVVPGTYYALIAKADFSDGSFAPYMGAYTAFNGIVAAGFMSPSLGPTPYGPGAPILQTFSFEPGLAPNIEDPPIDLPLPDGAVGAEVYAMGAGARPLIVGAAVDGAGDRHAVFWDYIAVIDQYGVFELPGGSVSNATDMNRNTIVGSIDGHPAAWPIDNLSGYTEHTLVDGEFTGVNLGGTAVGLLTAGGGIVGPLGGPFETLPFEPMDVNDQRYIVGGNRVAPSVGLLRLRTGAIRPFGPGIDGSLGTLGLFVTNGGLIGGGVSAGFGLIPQMWNFALGPDADGDRVPDGLDLCPDHRNPDQIDSNSDFIGDLCTPPVASLTASHVTRPEGSEVIFDATDSTDPFGKPLSYAWDFADGPAETSERRVVRHAFTDNGTFDVQVTVSNNNASDVATISYTVTNVRPTLSVTPQTLTPTVGASTSFQLDIADAGAADIVDWHVQWADGTAVSRGTCGNSCTVNPEHVFTAPGTYRARAIVTDDDGGSRTVFVELVVSE